MCFARKSLAPIVASPKLVTLSFPSLWVAVCFIFTTWGLANRSLAGLSNHMMHFSLLWWKEFAALSNPWPVALHLLWQGLAQLATQLLNVMVIVCQLFPGRSRLQCCIFIGRWLCLDTRCAVGVWNKASYASITMKQWKVESGPIAPEQRDTVRTVEK